MISWPTTLIKRMAQRIRKDESTKILESNDRAGGGIGSKGTTKEFSKETQKWKGHTPRQQSGAENQTVREWCHGGSEASKQAPAVRCVL